VRRFTACCLIALFAAPAAAQSPFESIAWRSIGPVNTGGRIDDIDVARSPGQPDAIYVATASGGLFKSSNNGVSFEPVFDHVNGMLSIGDVAVAPSDPRIVWVGTGEANTRQSSSWGDGVYRSTDAGSSWTRMGLRETRSIGRIVIDPTDANTVFVAAQGHLWGPNGDRGVFKTTDGGKTWRNVLFVDENTGANDVVIDPTNPKVLFAAMYQRQRTAWGFNGGGKGSGIYKSVDGGEHWTRLAGGLPTGEMGRIAISLYAKNPSIVYATVEAHGAEQGIYRTANGGDAWTRVSSLDTRPNYFSQIRVDPNDDQWVYTLGSNRGFYYSHDGGAHFTEQFSNVHGEDHALWVDPRDGNHLIIGGDGGVSISWDRGHSWDFRRNLPIGQFYELSVDQSVPYRICGGLQDNGVWCVPSAVRNRNGIADRDAWSIGGGDGFHALFDPADSNLVLQSSQEGNASWVNLTTLEHQGVRPGSADKPTVPPAPRGDGYRWLWDTPIIASPTRANVWYMGAQYLFRSTNRGSSWERISPDLTLHIDRDTLQMMGAVVPADALSRHDGQTDYGSLSTIGESPLDAQLIYTGSDDGQLQVTRDGGKNWTSVTGNIPGLPARTYVTSVLPSRYEASRVYATFDGHYNDDYSPYVFVSDDYGATWRSLARGLPEMSVNRIREHPTDPDLLVIGESRGAAFSNDRGRIWHTLTSNLPMVPVNDLVFQPRDNALILATHGRGLWVLDDVARLEALTTTALAAPATLVPPPHARLMSTFTPQAWYGAGEFFAPNPDWNGVIEYNLRDPAAGPARITVTDASGKIVRELTGPANRGVNRVDWDLRYQSPVDSAGSIPASPRGAGAGAGGRGAAAGRGGPPAAVPVGFPARGEGGFRGGPPVGPLVMPGSYHVQVAVPGIATPLSGTLVVDADPLPAFRAKDRATRQAMLMRIYDWTKALGAARVATRQLIQQHDALTSDLGAAVADSLNARITRLASSVDLAFTSVSGGQSAIEAWSGLPTLDQRTALGYAMDDGRAALSALDRAIADVASAYKAVGKPWPGVVGGVTPPRT